MRETISNQSVVANNPPEPAADDAIDATPNATPTTIITVANKPTVPLQVATSTVVGSSSSSMKRPLTLDLNAKPALSGGAKRQRFNTSVIAPVSVLNSPDLQMLNQASPELEKFMTASNLQTPTPSLVYPTRVTTEQEDYAKGFVDALNSLHNCETSQQQSASTAITTAVVAAPLAVSDSGANVTTTSAAAAAAALVGGPAKTLANSAIIISTDTTTTNILSTVGTSGGTITRAATYTNLDSSAAVANSSSSVGPTTITSTATTAASIGGADTMVSIKDEPVPSPPPHSPIDMNDQERIKLERKRQRNRVAASKCRKRKLERISKLEDKVKTLKSDNSDLGLLLKQLKENVCKLKQQVIEHINSGCNITTTDQKGAATNGGAVAEADIKH